jgi:hypothetical protein
MRRLICALLVAVFATALPLIARVDAAPTDLDEQFATRQAAISAQAEPSPTSALYATVIRPFGASIRVAPSPDAVGLYNVGCGAPLPVSAVQDGWVKVRTSVGDGWVGGGRLALSDVPLSVDCADTRFMYQSADAWALVPDACASLQARPSRDASSLDCVENGHRFTVVDGPFDPGTGQDWFKVTSPSTGTGWLLAEHLYPL